MHIVHVRNRTRAGQDLVLRIHSLSQRFEQRCHKVGTVEDQHKWSVLRVDRVVDPEGDRDEHFGAGTTESLNRGVIAKVEIYGHEVVEEGEVVV